MGSEDNSEMMGEICALPREMAPAIARLRAGGFTITGAHGYWNAVIQGAFDRSTSGRSVWVGESGVLTAAVLILFATVLYRVWPLAQLITLSKPRVQPHAKAVV